MTSSKQVNHKRSILCDTSSKLKFKKLSPKSVFQGYPATCLFRGPRGDLFYCWLSISPAGRVAPMLSLMLCLHWGHFTRCEHHWGMPEKQPTGPFMAGAQNRDQLSQHYKVFTWGPLSFLSLPHTHPHHTPCFNSFAGTSFY